MKYQVYLVWFMIYLENRLRPLNGNDYVKMTLISGQKIIAWLKFELHFSTKNPTACFDKNSSEYYDNPDY